MNRRGFVSVSLAAIGVLFFPRKIKASSFCNELLSHEEMARIFAEHKGVGIAYFSPNSDKSAIHIFNNLDNCTSDKSMVHVKCYSGMKRSFDLHYDDDVKVLSLSLRKPENNDYRSCMFYKRKENGWERIL